MLDILSGTLSLCLSFLLNHLCHFILNSFKLHICHRLPLCLTGGSSVYWPYYGFFLMYHWLMPLCIRHGRNRIYWLIIINTYVDWAYIYEEPLGAYLDIPARSSLTKRHKCEVRDIERYRGKGDEQWHMAQLMRNLKHVLLTKTSHEKAIECCQTNKL